MLSNGLSTFMSGAASPDWCELREFAIHKLVAGMRVVMPSGSRRRVLVTSGTVQYVREDGSSVVLKERQFLDAGDFGSIAILAVSQVAEVVCLSGKWGDELGGCGIFEVGNVENPTDAGDPVAYPKRTTIDSHYHDCDEYWIVLSGRGTVVVGERVGQVGAGDCVPIRMGHHHDLPEVADPIRAVFFETTLQGEKRVGHLWNHTHGPARPQSGRV